MSKLIVATVASALLSNDNVANYHSTRFGGVAGTTIALGERDGKVVAFWADRQNPLAQVVRTFTTTAELATLPAAFKASTGLTISDKSLRKLAAPHMALLASSAGK